MKSMVLLLAAASAFAQTTDSLEFQHVRQKVVTKAGKETHYPANQWSLESLPAYSPESRVSGTLRMWGLNFIGDSGLAKVWEAGFRKYQPDVRFDYHLQSALLAMSALSIGAADLAPDRKITWTELVEFQRVFDHPPLEIAMATGSFDVHGWTNALAIVVHKDNPISRLSMRQLDGIFGGARNGGWVGASWHPEFARGPGENIRTWGQLGLQGEWKDKPIHVYGWNYVYQQSSRFAALVFHGSDKWTENLREYTQAIDSNGAIRSESEQLMGDLSNDPHGIAYGLISDLTPRTKAIALATRDEGPYVEMTIETVHNRTYPLFQEVYWYVNRTPGRPLDPKVKEYLRYVLSREGQEAVARDGKYLPLTAGIVQEQMKKLE